MKSDEIEALDIYVQHVVPQRNLVQWYCLALFMTPLPSAEYGTLSILQRAIFGTSEIVNSLIEQSLIPLNMMDLTLYSACFTSISLFSSISSFRLYRKMKILGLAIEQSSNDVEKQTMGIL